MAQPKHFMTEEAYLQRERRGKTKHEYYAGHCYAMAGASESHNLIAMNIAAFLHRHLRGRSCRAYPSDMRMKVVATDLYTYPDFTVVCGQSLFTDTKKRDTLTNPTVLIEILSPSTERYDRGMKFQHYRTIETLREYILVAQNAYHIERFTRQANNEWVLSEAIGMDASLPIVSIEATLSLYDVYEQVVVVADRNLSWVGEYAEDKT